MRRIAVWLKSVLCEDALKMAIRYRRLPMGLIHHSDRGVQYACGDYRKLLRLHGRRKWRRLNGSNHLAEVIQGVTFKDGIKQIQHAA